MSQKTAVFRRLHLIGDKSADGRTAYISRLKGSLHSFYLCMPVHKTGTRTAQQVTKGTGKHGTYKRPRHKVLVAAG